MRVLHVQTFSTVLNITTVEIVTLVRRENKDVHTAVKAQLRLYN